MEKFGGCHFAHFPFRYGHTSDVLQQLSYLPTLTAYNEDSVLFRFYRSLSPIRCQVFYLRLAWWGLEKINR